MIGIVDMEETKSLSEQASEQLSALVGEIAGKLEDKRAARDKSVRDVSDMRRQIEGKQAKLAAIEERLAAQESSLSEMQSIAKRSESASSELRELQEHRGLFTGEARSARMAELWRVLESDLSEMRRSYYARSK